MADNNPYIAVDLDNIDFDGNDDGFDLSPPPLIRQIAHVQLVASDFLDHFDTEIFEESD
jgi:hypothetical protein